MLNFIKNNVYLKVFILLLSLPFLAFVLDFYLKVLLNLGRFIGSYLSQFY